MTLVSILCGAYNEEEYLPETIPAILAQTHQEFELLIINNGSTDRTGTWLDAFAKGDRRMRVIHEATNINPWIRKPVDWCAGAYVLTHGADDLMHPTYISTLVQAAEAQNANCVFSPQRWIDCPQRGTRTFPPYDAPNIAEYHQIPAWRLVSRDLMELTGGDDPNIPIGGDWDWAVRATVAGLLKPYQLTEPLISLRVRPPSRRTQSDHVDWPKLHAHMRRHTSTQWATWTDA